MKLVKENLTEKEFFDMQDDIECEFEDITYWSDPVELADGLIRTYCYNEEDKEEDRIYIYYKEKRLDDGTRLFNIYE